MTGSIGIKEANGKFYSILEVNSPGQKRLVLTTAHEKQKSVQIDLYKSNMKSMADAMYIGSLVMENVISKAKGTPSIEMTVSMDDAGSVNVDAVDLGNSSNVHHLSISLGSFEDDKLDYPDFEAEMPAYSNDENPEGNAKKKSPDKNQKRKKPWLIVIIIAAALALICLGLWYYAVHFQPELLRFLPQFKLPFLTKTESVMRVQPAVSTRRAAQPAIGPEGITCKVLQGDTLWDIAGVFYRNPRYYTVIARSNDIANEAIIAPGTELTIFPKR
ncbi:MAG: Hsp70 family protein [Spirochaetaceae bacterium]|jgi:hypothetical protein|nr:Hsp70 family protein [Spirochaetaceae bacterium]